MTIFAEFKSKISLDFFRDVILDFDWREGDCQKLQDAAEARVQRQEDKGEEEAAGGKEEHEEGEKAAEDDAKVQLVSWSKDQVLRIWNISQDIKFRL